MCVCVCVAVFPVGVSRQVWSGTRKHFPERLCNKPQHARRPREAPLFLRIFQARFRLVVHPPPCAGGETLGEDAM